MKNIFLKKGFVLTIIVLFIGISIIPLTGGIVREKYDSTENLLTGPPMVSNTVSPDVTIVLNGTMGANGWYVSCVTITFVYDPEVIAEVHYKIDIGSWQIYTEPFVICEDGLHTIYYYAVDMDGNQGIVHEAEFKIDQTPPTTTHEFDGMLGENGWYVSDVTVTLNAEDETSGVDYTMYKLEDDTEWREYTGPFVITEDGYHILQYYSVDNAGNIEDVKFCWFKIDQIIYYHDLIILPKEDNQVEFIANVIDKTSNIERVEFYIDEVLRYTDYEFPFKWNYLGEITLGSIVYDIAGNGAVWRIPISTNLETHGLGYPLQINEIENHFSGEMVLSDTSLFLNTGFSDVILYGTMGENGWYISDVIIEFTSAENNTYYRINGGGWEIYTGPIVVSDDGWYFLEYYSEYEPVKYVIFKIDQTPPLIDPIVRDAGFYRWEIIACVYDETSNVNRVEFYVDNELVKEDGEFPFTYTYNGFQGNIKAIVYDKAGHLTENSSITSQSQNHISSQQSSSSSSDQSIISVLPSSETKSVEKCSMPTFDGNTLYVGGSGPGNYTTIQEAIDNANDGDTVFVYSGIYNEAVKIQKNIDLIGEDKHTTIIDGEDIPNRVGVVFLRDGGGSWVTGFTIQNGRRDDVYGAGVVIWTDNNIVTGNIITKNKNGFLIYGDYNMISENIIKYNTIHGINICDSYYNYIINNTFESDDGIYISCSYGNLWETWGSHTIEENTANGRPIYYYKDESGIIVPDDAAQVILANCNDCIVQNLNISDIEVGILIGGYSYGNHVIENSITQSSCGIEIRFESGDNHISGNIFTDNSCGIWMCDSSYNSVYENIIEGNNIGVAVLPSVFPLQGGELYRTSTSENDIYQNEINNNDYGVYLSHTWYNDVFENSISNNEIGVFMEGSYGWGGGNTIYQNNITNNDKGLSISTLFGGMSGNIIYQNNFFGNEDYNADSASNNIWDDDNIGNYWDDYEGFDEDNDGIGDTPHHLGGDNKDNYPIMTARGITSNPPDKPTIDGPIEGHVRREHTFYGNTNDPDEDNIRYVFDWGDNSITWTEYHLSGETGQAEHMWWLQGTYTVRVKARDRYGYESEWSDLLSVTMPRNRVVSNPFLFKILNLNRFMSCFPLLEQMLLSVFQQNIQTSN